MRNKIAKENTTSVSLKDMRLRVLEAFSSVTAELEDCKKAVIHCEKIERQYYSYQQIVDSDIRPVMITVEVSQ